MNHDFIRLAHDMRRAHRLGLGRLRPGLDVMVAVIATSGDCENKNEFAQIFHGGSIAKV